VTREKNSAEVLIVRTMAMDWHWMQPNWPASRDEAASMAKLLIVYRCFYCGAEMQGAPVLAVLHHQIFHPGKQPAITMYPAGLGIIPRGGDQ
jgi:hypothetical protein